MQDQKDILRGRLDKAVDAMDMVEIERQTALLEQMQPPIAAEDPKLFAARIKKMDKECNKPMNLRKPARTVLIAAAIVATLSVGVFAANNVLKHFSFERDGIFYEVTVKDEAEGDNTIMTWTDDEGEHSMESELRQKEGDSADVDEYDTLEQAEDALGIKAVKPGKMPDLPLAKVRGQESEHTNFLWASYGDNNKYLGITISKDLPSGGDTSTSIRSQAVSVGSTGSYKTANGDKFDTVRDEEGAEIATIWLDKYEYTLVFKGFSEKERHEILDSVDLSSYR